MSTAESSDAPDGPALAGCRIAVPESRALDLFAGMLERQGAVTIRCPMVSIHDVEDAAPVEAWLRRLAQGEHDDLIFYTGEGVTRLLGFARRAGLEEGVLDAMKRARKFVRGPKPAAALRRQRLAPDISVEPPTTDGIVAALHTLPLEGRRVGVQLYPDSPDTVADYLTAAGARPDPVLCYRYASDEEDARVAQVIDAMSSGDIDLIAFTSSPQIRRLQQVAGKTNRAEALATAMQRTQIAAIGPVTAEAVTRAGWKPTLELEGSLHLKPFVGAISELYRSRAWGDRR